VKNVFNRRGRWGSRAYPVHSLVWTATRASDADPPKILIRPGPIMLAAMTKANR